MEVLALIPARSGSKRLPGKNILPLNGKPLIQYTIEAWQQSKYAIGSPIVSTDSDEILLLANRLGAKGLKRPGYLSNGDLTGPHVLIQNVIDTLAKYYGYRAGVIVLLQPTSPLRATADIDACLDLYAGGQCDSVTSVCKGKENGAVYVTHANLVQAGSIYGRQLAKYEMPPERSIDIDTQADFEEAERLLRGEQKGVVTNDNRGGQHKLPQPGRGKAANPARKR